MTTKLYRKRLEILEKAAGVVGRELVESKKGSMYLPYADFTRVVSTAVSEGSVNKSNIHKYGDSETVDIPSSHIVGVTTRNRMIASYYDRRNTSIGTLSPKFFYYSSSPLLDEAIFDEKLKKVMLELFLYNKRAEWIRNWPKMIMFYNLCRSFKSLKEMKMLLGYGFISDEKFYSLDMSLLLTLHGQPPSAVVRLLGAVGREAQNHAPSRHYITDTVRMARANGFELKLTGYLKNLRATHDMMTKELHKVAIESISDEKYDNPLGKFEGLEESLPIKWLRSPRDLHIEGLERDHCVGGYKDYLRKGELFACIVFGGDKYTAHLKSDGAIRQVRGYKNKAAPNELLMQLQDFTGVKETLPLLPHGDDGLPF